MPACCNMAPAMICGSRGLSGTEGSTDLSNFYLDLMLICHSLVTFDDFS